MRRLFFLATLLIPVIGLNVASAQSVTPKPLSAVDAYYAAHLSDSIWGQDTHYDALVTAVEGLTQHGLDPEHYHIASLKALRSDKVARDRVATDAWFKAGAHLSEGKLNPVSVEPDWTANRRTADLAGLLTTVLKTGDVSGGLNSLAPQQAGYAVLKSALAAFDLSDVKSGPQIETGAALKSGMKGTRVEALQNRLAQLGLIIEAQKTGVYDGDTRAAVALFQDQNDLDADGVAGSATITALNRDTQDKINALRVNMERFRWLPDVLGRRHVRVNIAEFKVTAWKDGVIERVHLGIVGKPYRKTPVFSDEIEYAIFNPWWETPSSLARKDKLPAFQKDPGAVTRLGFQVLDKAGAEVNPQTIDWNTLSAANFPYRLRQAPGDVNALGQVKIIFPNIHNVYLHDTPTRDLFAQRQRAFSSGCIRTQNPIGLSEWLLTETPGWDRSRIDAALATRKETRATLAVKIPVHILYNTVVAESSGGVRYLDDIYNRDDAVLTGLNMAHK